MNISDKIKLGKNVKISDTAKIFDNVVIEDGVSIGDFCLIGYSSTSNNSKKLIIKKNAKINSHSIIYLGSSIGENSVLGHNVLVREETIIENNVQIGSFCDIEGYCVIEPYSKLHSNVHVGQKSKIMSYSWLFPYVILTNDPIPPSNIRVGVTIEPFSIVCTRATILPGKTLGFGSFVGANSLVNINLKPETIGTGNPFKQRGSINQIKIPNEKKSAYPWTTRFNKDYPKDVNKIYSELRNIFIKS
jgi:acetyltransferase-like isoleucine patch superfamily enzyme